MPELHTKVIINPEAGSYSVRKEWPLIRRQLQDAGLSFDSEFTKRKGHAIEIAGRAIENGFNYLIAVGGDGTVNEVANGILRSGKALSTTLGVVNAGTAHAFSASLSTNNYFRHHTSGVWPAGRRRVLIDVGVVRCLNQGQQIERFFLNEASTGFSADIVDSWNDLPARAGKVVNLAFRTVAAYRTLSRYHNKKVRLQIGDEFESRTICTVMVSNGPYCANKMLMAPGASLDDGLFNAIIAGSFTKMELLKIVSNLYDGSHIGHPKIREKTTTGITIESDESMLVEADGEIVGKCPASFQLLPAALALTVPAFLPLKSSGSDEKKRD